MPTAFITGGTGFLGFNLIEQLLADNWDVVALHRPSSNLKNLRGKNIRLVEGSIINLPSLIEIFPNRIDSVFHVAGNTNLWSPRNHIQFLDNVVGTQNMVTAAWERHAKRFVHTSSIAAYGHHQEMVTEDTPSNAISSPINYHRTKYLAELEVRKGLEKGLDAVILNPVNIIGPYDYHNWSQLFILLDRQKLPALPQSTQTYSHVKDVAKAHIAAFRKGKKGENYLLGGVAVDYVSLAQQIGQFLGKPSPKRMTPKWLLSMMGWISLWGSFITGKEPIISPEKAHLLNRNMVCDSQKAEKELGYRVAPLKTMIEDSCRWMRSEGMLGIHK